MHDWIMALDGVVALLALGAIAFGDALVGLNAFVIGEVAFLAAGAIAGSGGSLVPVVVVFCAAWSGDLISYWIGRTYGPELRRYLLVRRSTRKALRQGEYLISKHGVPFIIAARLLGPVAWVAPFLAGTARMKLLGFVPASAMGVCLGVGQFVFYGFIGSDLLSLGFEYVMAHLGVVLLALSSLAACVVLWRSSKRSPLMKTVQTTCAVSLVFIASNAIYIFGIHGQADASAAPLTRRTVCDLHTDDFSVVPGKTNLHLPQPINVILLSPFDGSHLMKHLGWHRNMTYSHDQIGLAKFFQLMLQSTPPVSELYLAGHPADSAHQLPGTVKEREHVRWWSVGSNIHLGAISKTDEFAIKYYSHLPVMLHDIDPHVDRSRDLLARQTGAASNYDVLGITPLSKKVVDGVTADFETDGRVLIIAHETVRLSAEMRKCLLL